MSNAHTGRLHEIDGIRGWAALSVLLYHAYIEMFLHVWPEMNGFMPRFIVHGPLAVSVFFVLSGDALSSAYFMGGQKTLDAMVVKRYFRLTLPILTSCFIVWLILNADLAFNVQAGKLLHHESWLGDCVNFKPTVMSFLHYVSYGVYLSPDKSKSYNPFLWTMSVELMGSMLVFLYLYIHPRLQRPTSVLVGLAAFLLALKSFYGLFFMGVLFSIWRREGFFDRLRASRRWKAGAMLLVLVCFALDAWNLTGPNITALNMLLGPALVLAFYSTHYFVNFYSTRLSGYLGHISFSLYLVHFSVLISLASWLVVELGADQVLSRTTLLGIATTVAIVSIGAATALWRLEIILLRRIGTLPNMLFKPVA
jgi:peptidoglycan/LPS O-acetylase OafA/YrhL